MSDFRLALRRLRKSPVVSATIVLSLGLGVGVTTAIFSLVNGLLLRPLPVAEPDRLVTLTSNLALQHGLTTGLGWNLPIWHRLHERADLFDGALAWIPGDVAAGSGPGRGTVRGLFTSGTFFPTLGIQARFGRLYGPDDDVRGGGPDGAVAVISDRFWERRFGRDRQAIGSRLDLGAGTVTIVGVTPPDFHGVDLGRGFDVAVPLGIEPALRGNESAVRAPNMYLLMFMLRLKAGQSVASAEQTIQAIQPDLLAGMKAPRMASEPIRLAPAGHGADSHRFRWSYRQPLIAIFMGATLALLVAVANIGNLLFARALARSHELSLRVALGAIRSRLVRLLLTEGAVLAACGSLAGLAVAWWAIGTIAPFLSRTLSVDAGSSLDWRVLAFIASMAGIATMFFGAAPAGLALRASPAEVLKSHDRRAGSGRYWTSGVFVVVQVALSMVLVVVTGLLASTFGRLAGRPLGFDADRLLIVDLQPGRALSAAERSDLSDRLVLAALGTPGVAAAALSRLTPLSDASNSLWAEQRDIDLQNSVTPGWFAAYGTALHAGRDFDRRDAAGSRPVAIVNEAYRRKHFGDRNPIGEVVNQRTIVGVVGDAVFTTVRAGARPTIYEPMAQSSGGPPGARQAVSVSVRPVAGPPSDLGPALSAALSAVSPALTVTMRPLTDDVASSIERERTLAALSGLFATLALALGSLGLYGLMSHLVANRSVEIGVRLALGARPGAIARLMLRRALILIAAGIAIGTVAAVWASGLVASLLFDVRPHDPVTLVVSAGLMTIVGLFAAGIPAVRAARSNPARTLRLS